VKIVGTTDGGYLVEASEHELALVAGYKGHGTPAWRERWGGQSYGSGPVKIPSGSTIDVKAIHSFLRDVEEKEQTARGAAETLRALASLIAGAMPTTIILPEPPQESTAQ
jgi:hypothetical protein